MPSMLSSNNELEMVPDVEPSTFKHAPASGSPSGIRQLSPWSKKANTTSWLPVKTTDEAHEEPPILQEPSPSTRRKPAPRSNSCDGLAVPEDRTPSIGSNADAHVAEVSMDVGQQSSRMLGNVRTPAAPSSSGTRAAHWQCSIDTGVATLSATSMDSNSTFAENEMDGEQSSKSYQPSVLGSPCEDLERASSRDMRFFADVRDHSRRKPIHIDREQYDAIVRNMSQKENSIKYLRTGLVAAVCAFVVLGLLTLGTNLLALEMAKETHVNDKNELVSLSGKEVLTGRPESFSTLSDLSFQDVTFLQKMKGIHIQTGKNVQYYVIAGFTWSNTSYMEIETTRGRDIIVAAGKAFLRETSTGHVLHATTPASEPECGRRLSARLDRRDILSSPHAHSWEELGARFHEELDGLNPEALAQRRWRRLGQDANAPMGDLFEWFGAVISSEVSAGTARTQAKAALDGAYCDFDARGLECAAYQHAKNAQPPALSESGLNKFVLTKDSDMMLLYLDVSDWLPDSKVAPRDRTARSKMATGIVLDEDETAGSSIRVTETQGAEIWTYQMMHPSVWPERYNMSKATKAGASLDLAELVLESSSYQEHKGECRHHAMHSHDEKRTADLSVAFDCDDGTYTWAIAGWRIQASADGTVRGLVFSDKQGSASEDDDGLLGTLRYRVLSLTDGGDKRANLKLSESFEKGFVFTGCTQVVKDNRRLAPSAVLPGTNWCGPGQNPEHGDNYCLDSYSGDWACRRHDACAKVDYLFTFPILGCSCDKELHDATSRLGDATSLVISGLFGPYGVYPCIGRETKCRQWGWVESGRRRRWGWSYWGVTGEADCDQWHYINKYSSRRRLQQFSYLNTPAGHDLNSKDSWPGCYNNQDDVNLGNPFAGIR